MVYSAQAFLHNETDDTLTLVDSSVDGHWSWPAPAEVAPRSVGVLRTLAGGPVTGTGGHATYQVTGDQSRTWRLHWDNPFVGANTFQNDTDAAHYAFWSASSGTHPVVHFTLRPAGSVMTDFTPTRDGFQFDNQWPDPTPYSLPPLRGSFLDVKLGNAKNGLCGGMVFSALDYFLANWEIPQDTTPPPDETHPLFVELVNRIFDSFTVGNVTTMLKLMDPAYPDGDESVLGVLGLADGRANVMAFQEWPRIRADIDSGMPSPMFILTVKSAWPGDLGSCHQVLAYGYDVAGHDITLHVYDPNKPRDDETFIRFSDGDISQRIVVTHNLAISDPDDQHVLPVYCFTRMEYYSHTPKVRTRDKPTLWERDHRGVWLTVDAPNTTSGAQVGSGTLTLDVWPDCGEHDFSYVITEQRQDVALSVTTRGYVDPVLTWHVGEATVPPGQELTITVAQAVALDQYDEVASQAGDWTGAVGPVTLRTSTVDRSLFLGNEMEATNCTFLVSVECREASEDDPSAVRRAETLVSLIGRAETIAGYAEAVGSCVRGFIAAHEAGSPSERAAASMMRAQLGRPPDPLWDPDPTMVDLAAELAREDPVVADWAPQVTRPAWTPAGPTGPGGVGSIPHGPGDFQIPDTVGPV